MIETATFLLIILTGSGELEQNQICILQDHKKTSDLLSYNSTTKNMIHYTVFQITLTLFISL